MKRRCQRLVLGLLNACSWLFAPEFLALVECFWFYCGLAWGCVSVLTGGTDKSLRGWSGIEGCRASFLRG